MNIKSFSKTALNVAVTIAVSSSSLYVYADNKIEIIEVTAQKRIQSIQEVPIAITAFNDDDLKALGAGNLQELTEHIAGAELFDDRGSGQPTWVIRGVGLADFNSNNTPTAAIYYDEYYLTSNVMGGIGTFDIERVEILKGPQGGLYGRNTSGGAVRVISARPDLDSKLSGYLKGSYGRWDNAAMEGAVSSALSDTVAVRLSGKAEGGGGWQDSLVTPDDDNYGDRDFNAWRAQVLYAPNDDLEIVFKVEGGKNKSETSLGVASAIYNPDGSFCESALAGRADSDNCVVFSNVTNNIALTPGNLGLLPSLQNSDGNKVLSNPINALDNSWDGYNLRADLDLGFATLTSITASLEYQNNQIFDFDGTPLTLLHEDGRSNIDSWSQEFRLISNGNGSLSWLAGVVYAEDDIKERRQGNLSDNVFIFPAVTFRGFDQESESWAVYGQLNVDLTDEIKLNGSLRYTNEEKEMKNAFHEDITGDSFFYINDVNKSYELDDNWSGHVGIDWVPNNSDYMLYVKATKGFKSGGFNGGFVFSVEDLNAYEEEIVWSYETGFKSDLLDQTLRINGALYYYDYQQVQGFTQVLSEETGTLQSRLNNLGDAEHLGAEIDVIWLPQAVEGLTLNFGLAYLDAEISDSDTILSGPALVEAPLEGTDRTFAPKWSTTIQVHYERELGEKYLGAAQLNYSWRDDIVSRDSLASDLDYAAFGHDGYSILNARFSLRPSDEQWEVALVVKNLTNEEYIARATGDDVGNYMNLPTRPRSWAIEATYNFE